MKQLEKLRPPWVVVDVEASGVHPDDGARISCIGLSWPGASFGLPFDQGERDKIPEAQLDLLEIGGEGRDPNYGEQVWKALLAWLRQQRLIFHNAKYDLMMLRVGTRHWSGVDLLDAFWWDTMLGQHVLEPVELVGLDATARRLELGEKLGDDEFKKWLRKKKYPSYRYDLVPWYLMKPYVVNDVELTRALYEHQMTKLGADELRGTDTRTWKRLQREMDLCRALYRMEQRGVGFDVGRSVRAADDLETEIRRVSGKMPFKTDINSAKRWFYEEQGLKAERFTDGGEPSLDAEQARAWAARDVEWAAEYAFVKEASDAVSKWYRGYAEKLGADGRLRTVFKQTQVKSGRMSVGRVNLQAMPRQNDRLRLELASLPSVRDLLKAGSRVRGGEKIECGLWSLDVAGAEYRIAAHYAKCERMLKVIEEGLDPHGDAAQGIPELNAIPGEADWKEKRSLAKQANFLCLFGGGAEVYQNTLAKNGVFLETATCESIIRGWRKTYPEIMDMYEQSKRWVERKGWVPILPNSDWTEKSWFKPRDYPRSAWNRIVQGSLAAAVKYWLIEIEKEWPDCLVLMVHDSALLELPLDTGENVAKEVAALGTEMMSEMIGYPMAVDIERYA